jgi:hypothetical protein
VAQFAFPIRVSGYLETMEPTPSQFVVVRQGGDPGDREALRAVVEAAGLSIKRFGFGYASPVNDGDILLFGGWQDLLAGLAAGSGNGAGAALRELFIRLSQVEWNAARASVAMYFTDIDRNICLQVRAADLDLSVDVWADLAEADPDDLRSDDPAKIRTVSYDGASGWERDTRVTD